MLDPYKRNIIKVYGVIAAACILLSASFYYLGFKPLAEELRAEQTREIDHFLDSTRLMIKNVLSRHYDLARQTASRTAIRNKLAAYNEGRSSLEQLVAFSQGKLADAARANYEILGITRFDRSGRKVFSVGKPLPAGFQLLDTTAIQNIRLVGPRTDPDGSRYLLYYSPIHDGEQGRVGLDLLLVDDYALQAIADATQAALNNLVIARNGEVLYRPRSAGDNGIQRMLEARIARGHSDPRYIIKQVTLPISGWTLYAAFDRDAFFGRLNDTLVTLLLAVAAITVAVFLSAVVVLRPVIASLVEERRLYALSRTDPLTRLANRLHFEELLKREMVRVGRYPYPLSLVMFDADHFKSVNDQYGHAAGDRALQAIADAARSVLRTSDLVARYGGEEFIAILPHMDTRAAESVGERLREAVQDRVMECNGQRLTVTISVGVATYDPATGRLTSQQLIDAADRALYDSKRAGRNCVTTVNVDGDLEAGEASA